MKTEIKKQKTLSSGKRGKSNKKIKQRRKKVVVCVSIIIALLIIVTIILFSGVFTIKQITVINNSKVTELEIIQNSGLVIGNNLFTSLRCKIKGGIKTNPYIENVKITKRLSGEIVLDIEERVPTYMLQYENGYAYINNQGYILEISEIALEKPLIKGYKTTQISAGNRLEARDLKILETVIQIIKAEGTKEYKLSEIIKNIDISNESNIVFEIPSQNKVVEFGDGSNIKNKILWIVELIDKNKEVPGKIIVKDVQYTKKAVFRKKV